MRSPPSILPTTSKCGTRRPNPPPPTESTETNTRLRRAIGRDAIVIGNLEVRSKAYWKYDAAFMSAIDAALRPSEADIERWPFYILEIDAAIVGFFAFRVIDGESFLSDMFLDAPHIGRGIGRELWQRAVEIGEGLGYRSFLIESDPHAEGFYLAMGARRIGTCVSSDSGRELPLLRYGSERSNDTTDLNNGLVAASAERPPSMHAESVSPIVPHPRGENPYSEEGIERDARGVRFYSQLPKSIVHVLRTFAQTTPDAEAFYEVGGDRVSYRELWDRAAAVAGGLREQGIATGDRVAVHLPNGLAWALAFYGTMIAGAIAVPVNTRFSEAEVEYVVSDSDARLALHPGDALPHGAPFWDDDVDRETICAIFYTSGTTGFPKCATTTHGAFLTNCENMVRVGKLPRGVHFRTLISVPLFHVTGCNAQLLTALYLGGSSVVLPALDLGVLIATMASEKVDSVTTVPAVFALMLGHPAFAGADVSHVKYIGYGGAPMPPALVHRVKAAFPNASVRNGFGMTEGCALMTALPHEYADTHADSVGFACPTMDFALLDPDPISGVGELLARGANITGGYWKKPEATSVAIVDGWLHTGDMARIDERGFTYIVDRKKDMICRGGENVYCVEVENAFVGLPGVAEVAVLPVPDDVMGEKVGVVLVPLPGATLDAKAVCAALRGKIADFKIPQFAVVRSVPLPRNAGGKVLKAALQKDLIDWGAPLR